jgi:Uma2 family endonuclease
MMSTATTNSAIPSVSPKPHHWTREEYFRLAGLGAFDGIRVERIRGEIIDMSPIGWPHHLAKTLVADVLRAVFASGFWISEQGPFTIDDSDPEPDVAVIPGTIRDLKEHPSVASLIVEVAESSLTFDTTTKAELYAAAKVPEYWVLDLVNRRLLVFRDPAETPTGTADYRTRITCFADGTVAPMLAPDSSIRIADLLP